MKTSTQPNNPPATAAEELPFREAPLIPDEPTDAERGAALAEFFGEQRRMKEERREAVAVAQPALTRLCEVMRHCTGQSEKIGRLLYSLWNGRPASLLNLVDLDWSLRKDICAVMLAFGDESFFYDALKAEITFHGMWSWFISADLHDDERQVAA